MKIDGNIVFDGMHKSFRQILLSKDIRPLVVSALNKINRTDFYPTQENIFAFARQSADTVRVIILGPDSSTPQKYFAVDEEKTENLISWVRQGVLFLNIALTDTHAALWEKTVVALVQHFNVRDKPIVFLLCGDDTKKMRQYITSKYAHIVEWEQPDRLEKVNEFLAASQLCPINWMIDRTIVLNIDVVLVRGKTKYDSRATYVVCAVSQDVEMFRLSGVVLVDADYQDNTIRFINKQNAKDYAERVAREYIEKNMIGYLTIEVA